MKQSKLEELRTYLEPLKEEAGEYLKAVMVAGSAARKEMVEGSDIDIYVILDDTKEGADKSVFIKTKKVLKKIQDESPDELDLHFQKPKPLSKWWDLIISGEPWVVTSIKEAQPLYDPSDYVTLTKKLANQGDLHGTEERAKKLLERARGKIGKAKKVLLEEIITEVLRSMTDSAQAVLMYSGSAPPSPEDVADKLEEKFIEDMDILPKQAIIDYKQIYKISDKVSHGTLTDISGEEIENYLRNAGRFVKTMARLFDKLEKEKQENIVSESHEKAIELCKEALAQRGAEIPENREKILDKFREVFVDKGLVSENYWKLVEGIAENKRRLDKEGLEEMSEEEVYSTRLYVREFKSALEGAVMDEELPDLEKSITEEDVKEDEPELVEAAERVRDRLIKDHEKAVKSIWFLRPGEIKRGSSMTFIILYNDLEADEDIDDFEMAVKKVVKSVSNEKGIDMAISFYKLTNYWNVIRHGSPITFSEIRNGISVYDPSGFFKPLKKLLKSGRIPGSKEAMRSLIATSPRRVLKVKKIHKPEVVNHMYDAVVAAGQAVLISEGVAPPVPKKLPDELRKHLVESDEMLDKDVKKCEEIIVTWKNYEHDRKEEIHGKRIDKLVSMGISFIDEAEELMEKKLEGM